MGHYRADMCCNDCGNYICTCPKKKPDMNGNGPTNKRDVPAVANPWNISPMEWACMIRFGEGMTSEEVAASLALSVKTVSTYTTRAREKMEMKGGKLPTMVGACVLIDRFIREGNNAIPDNFAILVQMKDGQLTSRVTQGDSHAPQ